MDRKQHIRQELSRLLATAGPPPGRPPATIDLQYARRRRARHRFSAALEERVIGLGLEDEFAGYLACAFGADGTRALSDGDLVRAARWIDRCAVVLDAAGL